MNADSQKQKNPEKNMLPSGAAEYNLRKSAPKKTFAEKTHPIT